MITKSGEFAVYTVSVCDELGSGLVSLHDTSDGAAEALKELGFCYMTVAPDGWYGQGWYKHIEERDVFVKAIIGKMEVYA